MKEGFPQKDWLIDDPDAYRQQIRQNNRDIRARQRQFINLIQVVVKDDPVSTRPHQVDED